MAIVTGMTAAKMQEIYDASIVAAAIDANGHLIFTKEGGGQIDVGDLHGPEGPKGDPGAITKVAGVGDDGTGNIPLTAAAIGAATTAALAALVPSGTISMTGRSTAPSGWLLCQGQAVSRTDYASLYSAIGTSYGSGNNTSTFNLPDLRSRVGVGRNTADTKFDTMGEVGGEAAHTLTIAEMPSHSHKPGPGISQYFGRGSGDYGMSTSGISKVYPSDATDVTGGGAAHNNLQPYQVVNYMIKV